MQEEDKILSGVVDSLLERERYRITIPSRTEPVKRSIWDRILLRKIKFIEVTEQVFVIKPCFAGTMYRIADRSLKLPSEIIGDTLADVGLSLIHKHLDDVLYIISAAIENRKEEPEQSLSDLLRWNIEIPTIYDAFRSIIDDEEMQSFLNSIVLARGTVKILKPETNPTDGSE